jgi:mono/diheme cytochrome c family protein
MKRLVLVAALVSGALAFGRVAFAQTPAAAGEKIYTEQKCSMCHQVAGKGNKMHPLDGIGAKLKPEEIREWIVNAPAAAAKAKSTAKPPMKAYDKLAKADVDALVAYLGSLK